MLNYNDVFSLSAIRGNTPEALIPITIKQESDFEVVVSCNFSQRSAREFLASIFKINSPFPWLFDSFNGFCCHEFTFIIDEEKILTKF